MRGLVITLLVVLALGTAGVLAGCAALSASLPDPNAAQARGRDQSTIILDRNGRTLARLYAEQNRSDKPLDKMPVALRQAVVATEDQRFYQHAGVDPLGMLRAVFADVVLGRATQGGSTITQQYVKNAFGSPAKTLRRKIEEALLADKVERRYTKDQILELYLNTIYFGHGAYGVEAASETYFGKSVEKLTLPESAMIAGVIKSPGRYSPYIDAAAAKDRRDTVLAQMQQQDYITITQYAEAVAAPVKTSGLKSNAALAPYFVEWVKEQLGQQYSQDQLYRGGLVVKTTLDLTFQRAAEGAVASTLDRKGDPSAALVAIRPGTGEILAMVGGRDFKTQQFNAAVQGNGRQPGSAFKPFVLATALANGVSPEQTFESGPIHLQVDGKAWDVTGAEGGRTGPMRLREAAEKSVNSVFAKLITVVGPDNVVSTAEKMGLNKGITPLPAIALGGLTTGVTPLEMADAYATLAAGGHHARPFGVLEVSDGKGTTLFSVAPKVDAALDPQVAYLTTDILKGVIARGTGVGADIGRPAAGKTGTTTNNRDAWFVGYTPQVATAVWVGYPDVQKAMTDVHGRHVTGGSFPAAIWSKFMRAALAKTRATDFTRPDGLKEVRICLDTGLAATPSCPRTGTGLFLADTVVKPCNKHAAAAQTRLPNMVGMPKEAALALLGRLKLLVKVIEKDVGGVPSGTVADQTPKAGSAITTQTVVTLTVSDGGVGRQPPTAAFSVPATARVGQKIAVDASASRDSGRIVTWYWEFGDGGTASGVRASHTYRTAGSFDVTVWLTDDAGLQSAKTIKIKVR